MHLYRDSGLSDSDGATSDPRITGVVTGEFAGGYVDVEFDHDLDGTADGKSTIAHAGEAFVYEPSGANALAGHVGTVSLKYRTLWRSAAGVPLGAGDWQTISFTMIAGPGAGGLEFTEFALLADTGASRTDRLTVRPESYFVLSGTWSTDTAEVEFDSDGDGSAESTLPVTTTGVEYEYDPISDAPQLAGSVGPFAFFYRLVRRHGNGEVSAVGQWDAFRGTLEAAPASELTVDSLALVHDTGASATDRQTSELDLTAMIGGVPAASRSTSPSRPLVEFDVNGDLVSDGWQATDDDGRATFTPVFATYGEKTVRARVKHWSDAYGAYLFGEWTSLTLTYVPAPGPAVAELKLRNDTGDSAVDGVSRDPSLSGRLAGDDGGLLSVQFDLNDDGTVDATALADAHGNFTYEPRHVPAGVNTVRARSVRFDPKLASEVVGAWTNLSFTFESAPLPVIEELKLWSDTGESALDRVTTDPTLVGRLTGEYPTYDAGLEFDHDGDGQIDGNATYDPLGQFAYRPLGLGLGAHTIRSRVTQWDANDQAYVHGPWTSFELTVAATPYVPVQLADLRLAHDTGSSPNDHVSTDPAVVGTVYSGGQVANPRPYATVEIDLNNDGTPDSSLQTDESGSFRYVPLVQTPGAYTLRVRTRDWDYANRLGVLGEWQTFSYVIVAPFNAPPVLAQFGILADTGSSQVDAITANPTVYGLVTNDSGSLRLVLELDYDGDGVGDDVAYSDDQGRFAYRPEPVLPGVVSLRARPVEWDEASGAYLFGPWSTTTFTYQPHADQAPIMTQFSMPYVTAGATTNPTLSGRIVNEGDLGGVVIEVDVNDDHVPDQFASVDAFGGFSYVPQNLPFGVTTIHVRSREVSVETGAPLFGAWADLSFTLTPATNAVPVITSFALEHDTGASPTDGQTEDASLVGHVTNDGDAAGLTVQLDFNGDGVADGVTVTDAVGDFEFHPSGLSAGPLTLRARVKEYDDQRAVQWSAWASVTFTLLDPQATALHVDALGLAQDTGDSATDGATANATLSGHAANAGGQTLTVEFDWNGDGLADGTTLTNSTGDFSYSPTTPRPGYTVVRARLSDANARSGNDGRFVSSPWKSVAFVYDEHPDGAAAQAIVTAFANYNSNWQSARESYDAAYAAADQAYATANQTAQDVHDQAVAAAAASQSAARQTASASFLATVAAANTTLVTSLTAAQSQFQVNLANFTGDKTTFTLRDFEFLSSPVAFQVEIPDDSSQPRPPSDSPSYEGETYDFQADRVVQEGLAQAEQVRAQAVKQARTAFEAAKATLDATFKTDVDVARTEYTSDLGAAQAAREAAMQQYGPNPVDLAEELRRHEQRQKAARDKFARAQERFDREKGAIAFVYVSMQTQSDATNDAWRSQAINDAYTNPVYLAYYAEHFSYPPAFYAELAEIDEEYAQHQADTEQDIYYAKAEFERRLAEREAQAKYALTVELAQSGKTYDEKTAEHAHWEAARETVGAHAAEQVIAEADREYEVALAAATRKHRVAVAQKEKDLAVALEAADLQRMTQQATTQHDAVDSRAAFEVSTWWSYQKSLVDHSLQYVTALATTTLTQFTAVKEAARAETASFAQQEEVFLDLEAALRRDQRQSNSVSWANHRDRANDHAYAAALENTTALRDLSLDKADATRTYEFGLAQVQETYWKAGADALHVHAYAEADARAHHVDQADLDQKLAAAARDNNVAMSSVMLQLWYGNADLKRDVAKRETLAKRDYEYKSHEIERKLASEDVDSYEDYVVELADHAADYRKAAATKFLAYLGGVSAAQNLADHARNASAETLAENEATLTEQRVTTDASSKHGFLQGAAAAYQATIDAWNTALGSIWSRLQAAEALAETQRVNASVASDTTFVTSTAGLVTSRAVDLAKNEQQRADGVADALASENSLMVGALGRYSDSSVNARRDFLVDSADDLRDFDQDVLLANRSYRDKQSLKQQIRDDASIDAIWVYDRAVADADKTWRLASAQIMYDELTHAITAEDAIAQRQTASSDKADEIADADEIRTQSVVTAESVRVNGLAADYRDWVVQAGTLRLGLANGLKADEDGLASDLKTAVDALSYDDADADRQYEIAVAQAHAQSRRDAARTQANYANGLAATSGDDAIRRMQIDDTLRTSLVGARAAYTNEHYSKHSTHSQIIGAPVGALHDAWTYQVGAAVADAAWALASGQALNSFSQSLAQANLANALATYGANGLNRTLAAAHGAAEVAATDAEAAADDQFETSLAGHSATYVHDGDAVVTAAIRSSVIDSTAYDVNIIATQEQYEADVAAAALNWTSKHIAIQAAAFLAQSIPHVPSNFQSDPAASPEQDRQARVEAAEAAIETEYSQALKIAQIAYTGSVGDHRITLAGKLGDTLVTAATDGGDTVVNYLTSAASDDDALESAITTATTALATAVHSSLAGFHVGEAAVRRTLVTAISNADVQLKRDQGDADVTRATQVATAHTSLATAKRARVSGRYAALASAASSSEFLLEMAQSDALATWQSQMAGPFVTYVTSTTRAAADEDTAEVQATADEKLAYENLNVQYVTASEPLYSAAELARAQADRAQVEADAHATHARGITEGQSDRQRDVVQTNAIRVQGIRYAESEKTFALGLLTLPVGGDPAPLGAARDLAQADADLTRVTTFSDADVAWTNTVGAGNRLSRRTVAGDLATLETTYAAVDRDLRNSLAPYQQQLTIGAAAADKNQRQAAQAAIAGFRTAEYAALGAFEGTDHAARATAMSGLAAQTSRPWLAYQAALETARRDAFLSTEQSLLAALGSAINAAESTYQTAIGALYVAYFTSLAGSEVPYVSSLAARDYTYDSAVATLDAQFEQSEADAEEIWNNALAVARRNERVGRQTAARNFVATGDATTRDAAMAAVSAAYGAATLSASRNYTIADVTARGIQFVGQALAAKTKVLGAGVAQLASDQAAAAAERAFEVGAQQAWVTRNTTLAPAFAAFEFGRAQALADAVTLAAQNSSNDPWLTRDAAILQAQATYQATVSAARVTQVVADEVALRDAAIAEAYADETLRVARAGAKAARGDGRADAEHSSAVEDAIAELALAQTQSYAPHGQRPPAGLGGTPAPAAGNSNGVFDGRSTPKSLVPNWENVDRIQLGLDDFNPGVVRDEVRTRNFDFNAVVHVQHMDLPDTGADFTGRLDETDPDADVSRADSEPPTFESVWRKFQAKWTEKSGKELAKEFLDGVEEGFGDGVKDAVDMASLGISLWWSSVKTTQLWFNPALWFALDKLGYDPLAEEKRILEGYAVKFHRFALDAMVKGAVTWERREEIKEQLGKQAVQVAIDLAFIHNEIRRFLKDDGRNFVEALVRGDLDEVQRISKSYPKLTAVVEQVASFAASLGNELVERLGPDKLGYLVGQMLYEAAEDYVITAAWTAFTTATFGAGGVTGAPLIAARIANFSRKLEKFSHKLGGGSVVKIVLDKVQTAMWWTLKHADMCFVAGTLVHTREGLRPIETIRAGDEVASRPENSPETTPRWRRVVGTVVTRPGRLYHLTYRLADGQEETLSGTGEHPFWVQGRARFVAASELQIGDEFLGRDQSLARVVDIRIEDAPVGETFTTYNFEVEDDHTYLVGRFGVWVHNLADEVCDQIAKRLEKRLGKSLSELPTDELTRELRQELKQHADEIVAEAKRAGHDIAFNPVELVKHESDILAKLGRIAPNRLHGPADLERISRIRADLRIGKTRNIAFGEGHINGKDFGEVLGVSGKNTPGVQMPSQRIFRTGTDVFDRAFDGEVFVLENFARRLKPTDSGTIRLVSERMFCDSCSDVIAQFRRRFPNIRLILVDGTP